MILTRITFLWISCSQQTVQCSSSRAFLMMTFIAHYRLYIFMIFIFIGLKLLVDANSLIGKNYIVNYEWEISLMMYHKI